jgi:hypothetical protein
VEHLFKSTLALCCLALGTLVQPALAEEGDAPARRVDVNEYFVRGNTVLDAATIEEAVYPFLGPQKTLGDIEGARDALQKIYQARGYQSVFVELPEQKVDDGIVYLHVSETKVGRVRVVGAKHYSPVDIREQVPALKRARCRISPGANPTGQAQPQCRAPGHAAGARRPAPGTMDVDLQVEDQNPGTPASA